MKFVVASILFVALGDIAVNHGNGVTYAVSALATFCHWLGYSVDGSIWTW